MIGKVHDGVVRLLAIALAAVLMIGVVAGVAAPAQAHEGSHVLIFTETTQYRHSDAIDKGTPLITTALEAEGIEATHTEDSTVFNDTDLATYDAIIMFQTSGDPWNADQKAALERYQQAGGGIVAIHNATDMRGDYQWWDTLVGSLMPGHAATGSDPGQPGTVIIEDRTHPSTDHFDQTRWERADEWYNFSNNVRGTAHVLTSMDESTYDAGGNAMGYDHPISWCKPYDGGRVWVTAMGHFGSHYEDPKFMQHIVGGVKYAAGLEPGDCGGTVWKNFDKIALDQNTSAPFGMDIAADGRVFYTELVKGQVRVWDPETNEVTTAVELDVYSGGEDGLLGIALDPDFATNGYVYLYRSPDAEDNSDPSSFFNRVSRFTMNNGAIDPASEQLIIEIPARRLPDEPGHTGGGLDFGPEGNLYIGVGDDVNPHSEPSGGYAPLSTRPGTFHDARATSANTNDLRGKLLRVTPNTTEPGYTIPDGNLFPEAEDAAGKTLPEIYAMGFRNPFRFSVDQETGHISLADYSPDNSNDAPETRGPAGIAEWNYITSPGNYGWPLCMGNSEPFRDVDYTTDPVKVGAYFDCANPVNDSPRNTGLTNLPTARAADMWYGYQRSSVPEVIPEGGGLAPMGGPVYNYDPELESDTKFPSSYDGKPFFYEWARNKMYSIQLKDPAPSSGSQVEKVTPFLPNEEFLAPIDSQFGPDGSLYVLDWGGGFGRDNPNSGLHRIDYIDGSRSPGARISVDHNSGPAPLTVNFDASESTDPENEVLTYAWDFEDDGTVDATTPQATHTYPIQGVFDAKLTVTDPQGKTGITTIPITVGNTRPSVEFALPPTGSFFDFGDELTWDVEVTDPEDGAVDGADVIIQPALGHDGHAHPTVPYSGFTGTTETSVGGHAPDENIFFAIDARYTDSGGAGGQNPLTGSDTTLVFPKLKQAEFFDSVSENVTTAPSSDVEGIESDLVIVGGDGEWAHFDPVNFYRIDELALRVSAVAEGGTVELRNGAVDGELLATAEVPATGSLRFTDVMVDTSDFPQETFDLYVVFRGAEIKLNFMEAIGQGSSPQSSPRVAITAPQQDVELEPGQNVTVEATASDSGGEVSQVEFFVDGTSIGVDETAPYASVWAAPAEGLYELTAVATNSVGTATTSRIVLAQVGELFGDLVPFTNANGTFQPLGDGQFRITGAGDDAWQGTDEYSTLFSPGGGADDDWAAVVRIDAQENTHGSAKAGIIVRNDMTQPGTSAGYAMVGIRPSGGVEFLADTDGNGQLDVSTAGGATSYPVWVKLRRTGDNYSAYYSKNGTSWTQVGGQVPLGSAAATQDVGMFTVSHAASAGTVDFAEFAINTEPQGSLPSEPLVCAGASLSDEFNDPALSPSWTLRSAMDDEITQSGGVLNLPVTSGDINEASTGPVSFASKALPAGVWEATTKISLAHTSHWQWAGLVVHQNDDEYSKIAFVKRENGERFVEFQTETNGTRTTPAAPTLPSDFPTTIHLKLSSDGTALTGAYSADGETWTDLDGELPVKENAQIGIMAAGDLGATPVTAQVDWFHFSPEPEAGEAIDPNDEFDGTALDGCRWDQSVRYDSNYAEVADGHLKIETQVGDINANNPVSPSNFILTEAPEGDWVATTKFKAPVKHRYQLAGLLMWADDDNYVKADVVAYNAPGSPLDLRAELAGEVDAASIGSDMIDIADSTESGYWYMRVTKTANQYTAEVSDGGVNWTPIGDAGITFDQPLTGLGLMAIGPQQSGPVVVEFDYFHVGAEEEEPELVEVTPGEVTFTDADGAENDTFTVPEVEGVEYLVADEVIEAGTHPGEGTVTVTARATEGYVLAEGVTTEWTFEFTSTEQDRVTVPAEQVSLQMFSLIPWVQEAGLESVLERLSSIGLENIEPFGGTFGDYTAEEFRALTDSYGLSVPSSHYNVDESTFGQTLEFVGTVGQEYVGSGGFPAPGIGSYEDTLATAEAMNRLGQQAVEAGFEKLFGHNHDQEFLTTYVHNGEEMSAWEILVAETDPEYVTFQLDVGWATHAGVDVPALLGQYGDRIELLHVKDAVDLGEEDGPTFTNLGEGEVPLQDILAAAQEAGVAYYVMEYDMAADGEDFAATGFEYLTGIPAGGPGPELVEVTPGEVTFTDADGAENDTFTVPEVEGVEYLVADEVIEAGTHPGEGTVTVTARATDGYVLAEGVATEWTFEFTSTGGEPQEPVVVTPGEVTFNDEPGTENDSYTIPESEGVDYLLANQAQGVQALAVEELEPGTYPGEGTVTITARAADGYVLAEGATSEWTFEFSATGDESTEEPTEEPTDEPTGSGDGAPGDPTDSSGNLPDTGADVGLYAALAALLLLVGAGVMARARRVRI